METKSENAIALELFQQYKKIEQAEKRVSTEKKKLRSIAEQLKSYGLEEKITFKGDVFEVRCSFDRWRDPKLSIEKIASIKDLQALINSAK